MIVTEPVEKSSIDYQAYLGDDAMSDELCREKYWNPKPEEVFIDAGFGPGDWTLDAIAKGACVYAFDPGHVPIKTLTEKVSAKGYGDKCTIVAAGLWSRSGFKSFGASSFFEPDQNHLLEVAVTSLDDYFLYTTVFGNEKYIQKEFKGEVNIACINMDVEGSELEVVRGAKHLLRITKPRLIIEIHAGVDSTKLTQLLNEWGYKTWNEFGFLIGEAK